IETNIGGYHRVRWARGVLIPSPCVTDSRTLILWSQDPVPSFARFSDIPFPYGINILVATLFIFRERATAGDSAGDYLSKSILAFVCFVYWVFIYLFMCLHLVYMFTSCICLHIMFTFRMHLDYIMGPRGGHIFFCFVLQ